MLNYQRVSHIFLVKSSTSPRGSHPPWVAWRAWSLRIVVRRASLALVIRATAGSELVTGATGGATGATLMEMGEDLKGFNRIEWKLIGFNYIYIIRFNWI
jgi:hypothetical protein